MLRDCISKNRDECELLILRPDRFGRAAIDVRDRVTQALLLLDPPPVDVQAASLDEALDDEGVKWTVAALGVGIHLDEAAPSDAFRLDRLRYGTIVLVRDESPSYERALSVFTRFLAPLLTAGHAYAVDLHADLSEAEFERTVMNPTTRKLVPIR